MQSSPASSYAARLYALIQDKRTWGATAAALLFLGTAWYAWQRYSKKPGNTSSGVLRFDVSRPSTETPATLEPFPTIGTVPPPPSMPLPLQHLPPLLDASQPVIQFIDVPRPSTGIPSKLEPFPTIGTVPLPPSMPLPLQHLPPLLDASNPVIKFINTLLERSNEPLLDTNKIYTILNQNDEVLHEKLLQWFAQFNPVEKPELQQEFHNLMTQIRLVKIFKSPARLKSAWQSTESLTPHSVTSEPSESPMPPAPLPSAALRKFPIFFPSIERGKEISKESVKKILESDGAKKINQYLQNRHLPQLDSYENTIHKILAQGDPQSKKNLCIWLEQFTILIPEHAQAIGNLVSSLLKLTREQ